MDEWEIIENQTIYYRSSENMHEIEDNSIDVIVTSPPYNRKKRYSDDTGVEYNDNRPKDEYFRFLTKVWRECFRVLNPEGIFFLNIGDAAPDQGISEEVVQLTEKVGFYRLQTIIWIKSFLGKGHFTPTGGSRRLNNLWENVFVLVKDKKRYRMNPKAVGIPYADKSNIGRYSNEDLRDAGNVWLVPYSQTTGSTIKKGHEAPFPIELPYKCIKLAGGRKVLDPFTGTGSTLAAAKLLGKKGFGYEKFPRKKVIRKRIEDSSDYFPPTILIPHLEMSVRVLTRILDSVDLPKHLKDRLLNFSKKERTEMMILKDVLDQLNQNLPFLDEYFDHWENERRKKEVSKKIKSLSNYL
ncbi:MAG: site-specific DNA-methyltransferase [Candidatus Heimdallarchaeota archaeon]|nr:MAG: site-specific DNA-methyltransferase [Candidatus Heimdallarchaeota archaeon]